MYYVRHKQPLYTAPVAGHPDRTNRPRKTTIMAFTSLVAAQQAATILNAAAVLR